MRCILCSSLDLKSFKTTDKKIYHQCAACDLVFLEPSERLNFNDEKNRYLKHENDVLDSGYQNFVAPLFQLVTNTQTTGAAGLDYGSGKDSAISYLLLQKGFNVKKYDPFFNDDQSALQNKYDYIIVCEVAEHLYNPDDEFERLHSLLNSNGNLFMMTSLRTAAIDFSTWSYRRDVTHVCFYSKKTCAWISARFGFKNFEISNNQLIRFQK